LISLFIRTNCLFHLFAHFAFGERISLFAIYIAVPLVFPTLFITLHPYLEIHIFIIKTE